MFKKLRQAYQLAKLLYKYEPLADSPDFWGKEDGAILNTFLNGGAGSKLKLRLQNAVFRSAVQACSEPLNGDYNRGIARGIMLCVQMIDNHLPEISPATEQSGTSEEQDTSADLVPSAFN